MLRSQAIADPSGPLFLMESSGLYNQNQWIVNVNSKVNTNVSLFGSYVFNHASSNTDGLGTFPANPRDFTGEYGPAATDVRHRASLGGSINAMWNVRFSPLIVVESGPAVRYYGRPRCVRQHAVQRPARHRDESE